MSVSPPAKPWYAHTVSEAFTALGSSPQGLTQAEITKRQAEHGPNELQAAAQISPWEILIEQFKNVLIIILLAATVISAFLGEVVDAIAIFAIVLFAVILGFIQEYRAERAIEALRKMTAPTATVMRDGQEVEVASRELVPGDVVVLSAGDRVPADARVIEGINLKVEEAALTGESLSVEKHQDALEGDALQVGDRKNIVHSGTAVSYGRGRALVVATGMHTEFGKIAQMLQTVESNKTPLQESLDKVGDMLARAAFVLVGVIALVGIIRGKDPLEMLIFGVALAVAVVPEALPAVVTVSLAIGVQRMIQRHALVRRLPAVETLGSTTVICSDKTGTLTKDEMTVRQVYAGERVFECSGAGYDPRGSYSEQGKPVAQLPEPALVALRGGVLCADARLVEEEGQWRIKGDPTEGALLVAARKAGLDKLVLDKQFPRVGEIPFTSETKRMTTLHTTPEGNLAYSKGAPEILLEACTRQLTAAGETPLGAAERQQILDAAQQMASHALRVLAVTYKATADVADAEREMVFAGLLGMIDPPRPEAKAAIHTCEQAGIKVVMITGDHPVTAHAIARELGLLKHDRVITGQQLDALDDVDLAREVETLEVYARVSPAHKLRVVAALQANGHIVAMTGDGVNDAPALKKADIGIAMGITGTDVTKEAAAMTLTDDNFASIVAAVEEGRGIFGNVKKYLMYLLSSNIGEILIMAGAMLSGLPLPLAAVQILYINLATDGLPALALALDPPEDDLMQRKPRNPRTGIFTRPVVILMCVGGIWSAIMNLSLFTWNFMNSGGFNTGKFADELAQHEAMTMSFVLLALTEFFKAYTFRSDRHSIFRRMFANKWLNLSVLWEMSLLLLIIYVPFLHGVFHTFALTVTDWAIVLTLAASVVPVLEAAKWMQNQGWFGLVEA